MKTARLLNESLTKILISGVTTVAKFVTTAVDQTLTCHISELDASGSPVTVTWTDPDGIVVQESDTTNYGLDQGIVNSDGIQLALLTIKTPKLVEFAEVGSFTYKCSAKSSLYPDSPTSAEQNLRAYVLKLGFLICFWG